MIETKTVNEAQVHLGRLLGLDIDGLSIRIARAMIEDEIDQAFGVFLEGDFSKKQYNIARRHGSSLQGKSRKVGEAILEDIMEALNSESIVSQGLKPGISVINIYDKLKQVEVVSSISPNGTVYLKGGMGKRAWARSLQRIQS